MNPSKIKSTIAEQAQAAGIDPTGPLGYADLLGFGQRYNSAGRLGILGVPAQLIEDKEKFFSDPMAQIGIGIGLIKQAKDSGVDDFNALAQYTNDPSASVKAMMRGTKYSGQSLTPSMIAEAANMLGVKDFNPELEAQKAGIQLLPDEQPQQAVQQAAPEQPQQMAPRPMAQQMNPEPIQEIEMPLPESTPEQRQSRLQQAFGSRGQTSGLSPELNAFLKTMI